MAGEAEGCAMNVIQRLACVACAAAISLVLTGCGATMTTVKVPVPVECREETPTRPAMPTETLDPAAPLDVQNRAMRAEIDRREGYEGELLTALENCKRHIST